MERRQPVIWAILRSFMCICSTLGHKSAVMLGDLAGRIVRFFSKSKTARARSRVSRMLGVSDKKAEEIINGSYLHFGRALVEFIRLPQIYRYIDNIITVTGEEHIWTALASGHGVIMLSAHIGCWEYALAVLAKHGLPMNTIGADQRDDRITQAIADLRARSGVRPIGKGIDLRAAIDCLRRNEALAVMLDQDAKDAGILSPFLGHLASTPIGPIKLAKKYGTPVVPAHVIRDPDGLHMTLKIEPPLQGRDGRPFGEDVSYAVDRCNEVISGWIRETPEQWLWMYPRWESTLNDR